MASISPQLSTSRRNSLHRTNVISRLDIEDRTRLLIGSSLSQTTKSSYSNSLKLFDNFREEFNLLPTWPPPLNYLVNFISYLSLKSYSPSSIKLSMSAVSFCCKIRNLNDPTHNFIICKMLSGLSRIDKRKDLRMPVTLEILVKVILALPNICSSQYESFLFSSLFSLAFFGFFRVGELVQSSKTTVAHALQVQNVCIIPESNSLSIFVPYSKTDQFGKGCTIQLPPSSSIVCPVVLLKSFLRLRPPFPGSFFKHCNGEPVTRYQFVSVLKKALLAAGIHSSLYNSHSFRIGAATAAHAAGMDGDRIAHLGRWKSNCYKSYIRIPTQKLIT